VTPLKSLPILVLDCQASGATPAHGELLEIGWQLLRAEGDDDVNAKGEAPRAHWTKLTRHQAVSMPVRRLTGWDPTCLENAIEPLDAWRAMIAADTPARPLPTIIHYARFELPFLRDLHVRSAIPTAFPLDVVCLHAIAARLFPELPRRNIRALAGHLGHSADMIRRASGHVEATAFLWRALVPRLAAMSIETWEDLKQWIEIVPVPSSGFARKGKRVFPIDPEKRKVLPDAPGIYRFVRSNGDVLYVGKAVSLRKRVGSHFTTAARSRGTERAIEMLTQAHDITITTASTALEAALLEVDEIKRLDPPYNVQFRARRGREAWFASRCWSTSAPSSKDDEVHVVGPMPSPNAIAGIAAMRTLLEAGERGGAAFAPPPPDAISQRAAIVGVPRAFAPEEELFEQVWVTVRADFFTPTPTRSLSPRRQILEAAKRIDPKALEEEAELAEDEAAIDVWDAPRVRRHIERTIASEGAVIRRSKLLALLTDCHVAFREPTDTNVHVFRHLVLRGGEIAETYDSLSPDPLSAQPKPPRRATRLACFNAARYDRLRVLSTELRRIADDGGTVTLHLGNHRLQFAVGAADARPSKRRRAPSRSPKEDTATLPPSLRQSS